MFQVLQVLFHQRKKVTSGPVWPGLRLWPG